MGKIVITAKVELDDSNAIDAGPDYLQLLLEPKNWNDVRVKDGLIFDELRDAIINVRSIHEIEIVSVEKV